MCPYCKRPHHHGWPYGHGAQPGHRAAHCSTVEGRRAHRHGYVLDAQPEGST
jgi:hypothetical protein